MKFIGSYDRFHKAEALEVAEACYNQTSGMFACFEGQVWISLDLVEEKAGLPAYRVWVIDNSPEAYVPSRKELMESAMWAEIPAALMVWQGAALNSWKVLTKKEVVKWYRFN